MSLKRLSLLALFLPVLFSVFASPAYAQATLEDLETVFETAVSSVAVLGGFIAFLAIIYGGFKYITARGDPKAISGAQNTILWAVLGLAAIVIAWVFLVFLEGLTGAPVTEFNIKLN